MRYETITLERDGPVAILTLNRPGKLNALSDQVFAEVRDALDAVSVVWAPYRSFADVVDSLQASTEPTHIAAILNQPGVGPHWAPGSPLVAGNRAVPAVPAPVLGADSRAVLASWLGLADDAIQALVDDGVVADPQVSS